MKKRLLSVTLAAATATLSAPSAHAGAWTPVPRKIIALYLPKEITGPNKDISFTLIHQHAEVVLNHLGLEVEYLDASKNLPDPASFPDARGVVAWFSSRNSFDDPDPVCAWLDSAMHAGLRVVLLGQIGLYSSSGNRLTPKCTETLRELGIKSLGERNFDPLSVAVSSAPSQMIGFERRPDASEGTTPMPLVRLLPGGTTYLRLSLTDGPLSKTSPVAVTREGGVALDPFWLYANTDLDPNRFYWVANPFTFFEEAFALDGLPRPDVTTINGRRMYMTHVDGDGFYNLSEIDTHKTSGELFLEEFVERRPDTPFTLSLISGYLDLPLYNDDASVSISRRILNRPNVEPASHGYAHPMIWRTGTVALKIPGYVMDPRREIVDSVKILQDRIMPDGHRIKLFLWTGDALPDEAHVLIADQSGILAMNGGGGRFDREYPSYAYLFPLSRQTGKTRQIYGSSSNEEPYTNLWSGPYYGYRDVLETFKNTGAPVRIRPVDVYLHYFSAEKYASMASVRVIYEWARAQPFIPVWAGRYALAVKDFFVMRISQDGPRRFLLEDGPAVRTVRFDHETGTPDLSASKGVIGYRRELGSLYVSLDESDRREIVFTAPPAPRARSRRSRLARAAPARPPISLVEANFEIEKWTPSAGGVRFRRQGWWTGECTLAGLLPGRDYNVVGRRFNARLKADPLGQLIIHFPDSERGGLATDVTVEPAE
jgi:hypothetical protein